jgi:DNA helicase-2/ATP-dependent DNA helicase PcrA
MLGEDASGIWLKTFHSACVTILRREAERLGHDPNFTIYDSGDSRAIYKRLIKEFSADLHKLTPAGVSSVISNAKNELIDADEYSRNVDDSNPAEVAIAEIYRAYQAELRKNNAFDFDDLIGETVHLFRAFPEVAAQYQRKFRHILVDEYQDTNHAQYALIRELTKPLPVQFSEVDPRTGEVLPPASLTVVGDSDQSIYAFRGADIRNIIEFEKDFPGAKVVLLEQNYRSTNNILKAANAVISNNFDRPAKNLWSANGDGEKIIGYTGYSGHDEAQFIADEIEKLHKEGHSYREMAVFYRTNAQTRALEEIFIRSAIPYRVVGGTKFYERQEIKDAFAYLVAISNGKDDLATRRILNVPKRGIGDASETTLAKFAEGFNLSVRESLSHAREIGFGPKITNAMLELGELLDSLEAMTHTDTVDAILRAALDRSGYREALRGSRDPQDEARLENLDELVLVAKEFQRNNPEGKLADFLNEVALVAAADDIDDESGTVSLMTLHTAKGLEYDVVFLTGIEEGLLPHRMSFIVPGGLAEERRLFYVGITRARKLLHISLALARSMFGDTEPSTPSRFLQELPPDLIAWRDSGATRSGYGAISTPTHTRGVDRPKTEWKGAISSVRNNADLVLEKGDLVEHADFGKGKVVAVSGEGPRATAEINFGSNGTKRLLVRVAPIEKL